MFSHQLFNEESSSAQVEIIVTVNLVFDWYYTIRGNTYWNFSASGIKYFVLIILYNKQHSIRVSRYLALV